MSMQVGAAPFRHPVLNRVETLSLFSSMVLFVAGVLYHVEHEREPGMTPHPMIRGVYAAFGLLLLFLVAAVVEAKKAKQQAVPRAQPAGQRTSASGEGASGVGSASSVNLDPDPPATLPDAMQQCHQEQLHPPCPF